MPAIYDKFAPFYDRLFAPFERRFLGRWRAETLALLPGSGTVLELGCGTGANFEFYPKAACCISTELSARMLMHAAQRPGQHLLVQSDAQLLPFADNSFDAAFATLVFCSVPDPATAFAEVRRVVRSGGRFVMLEHVRPPGLLGRVFDVLNVATVALIDDHFNRKTAQRARIAGFEVTEVRSKAAGAVVLIVCRNP